VRGADFDHSTAMTDLAFLQSCDECLLTFRSTFSYAAATRRGTRCFYVEKEAPEVFQLSNSQAGIISMLFHFVDINDWRVDARLRVSWKHEPAMRYFYRYLCI
jgi:hypothetical protein